MSKIQDRFLDHYTLEDSIKKYKGYKVKSPDETVNIIKTSFEKINFKISYIPKNNSLLKTYYPFRTGNAILSPKFNDNIILLKSSGKGVTSQLAEASAYAELIERYTGYGLLGSGNINCYLAIIKRNEIWNNINKNDAIKKEFPFHSMDTIENIPEEFKKHYDNLTKAVCYSLTNNKLYSYPEEFIMKTEGSNGLASGNTLEEAILHAIFELVERLGGMYILDMLPKCKKISKESVTHPTLKKLIEAMDSTGIKFEMLDFSHVFGIPLVLTIFDHPRWTFPPNTFTRRNVQYPRLIIGVDTNPQDAAIRCFTELIQVAEPIYLSKYKEEEFLEQIKVSNLRIPETQMEFLRTATPFFINGSQPISIDLRKYLHLERDEISFEEMPDLYNINQKIEIENVVKKLKTLDIEVCVQDITHSILNFPVVRAIFSGGKDYFSRIPLNGYSRLILDSIDPVERYSRFNRFIDIMLTGNPLNKILKDELWLTGGADQKKLMDFVISDICYNGNTPSLWGLPYNKFYFLGMLYLRVKNYEQAKNCFNAALIQNLNDIPSLIGMAYIFSKKNMNKEYENIMHILKSLNKNNLDIKKELKEMDNNIIQPNPFETCDLDCKKKTKKHLCNYCFFNYVSEDIFMKFKKNKLFK